MSERRIPCPGCATRKRLSIDNERWRPCEMCGSVRDGTIPDRRAPSAVEDALRAEVVALKAKRICACGATVEELVIGEVTYRTNASSTNAKLMAEVSRLQAELGKPEPMVPLRLVEEIAERWRSFHADGAPDSCNDVQTAINAAIREARRK